MARRFRYYVAASIDGFIADANGGIAWLDAFNDVDYGIREFLREVDLTVLGRRTYDQAVEMGHADAFGVDAVVLTRRPLTPHSPRVRAAASVEEVVAHSRATAGKDVWVMGGGDSARAFLEAGALDELELYRIPTILGAGVPLFGAMREPVRMQLVETFAFPNGVVRERYTPLTPRDAAPPEPPRSR